jgi:hypothetical protein
MALNRVTRATGQLPIEGFDDHVMNVDFEYLGSDAPASIHFNINTPDGAYVDGNFAEGKISYYNVSNGIVSDECMTAAQDVLADAMKNYNTI